jgi:hypothetical protein
MRESLNVTSEKKFRVISKGRVAQKQVKWMVGSLSRNSIR